MLQKVIIMIIIIIITLTNPMSLGVISKVKKSVKKLYLVSVVAWEIAMGRLWNCTLYSAIFTNVGPCCTQTWGLSLTQ